MAQLNFALNQEFLQVFFLVEKKLLENLWNVYLTSFFKQNLASAEKTDDISKLILSAIREINQRSEIAGRSRIYWFLHDAGYGISEYKIRKYISMLAEQGLISATHGGRQCFQSGLETCLIAFFVRKF